MPGGERRRGAGCTPEEEEEEEEVEEASATFRLFVFFLLVGDSLFEDPGEEDLEEEPLLAGLVWAGWSWRKVWFSTAMGWLIWTSIVPLTVWTIWYIGWTGGPLSWSWGGASMI